MLKKVKEYVMKWHMLEKHDKLIVGVSGGADSICLLFVLLELQKKIPFEMIVVHLNHGIRGADADADERYVKKVCETHHLLCVVYSENVELIAKKRKQSTEEAGRDVRREIFQKTLRDYHGTKIAVAHHMNDSAETFLMNLARGTGMKGLGGIKPVTGEYIRPLLCLERAEIEEYLKQQQIFYCEDVTNAGDEYTRNRIRNHVIPYLEQKINIKTVSHISETMRQLQEVQQYLEEQTDLYYTTCVKEQNGEFVILEEEYKKVPNVLQPLIIKKALAKLAQKEKDIEEVHLQSVQGLMEKQVGKQVDLPYELLAKRAYEGVAIRKKENVDTETVSFDILFSSGNRECFSWNGKTIVCELLEASLLTSEQKSGGEWFDYDIITQRVCLRTRRSGDYITIHSDGRTQKLKSFFINEKVPQEERNKILLLADGNHVLWIDGFRTNCRYHVTENTKHILKVTIDEGESYGRDN